MPGMIGGHGAASLAIVAEFRSGLLAEGTLLFMVFVLLAIGWVACREFLLARARSWLIAQRGRWPTEPGWRRVLRIGFGVLWIVDGLLQAQPAMPTGLPSQVIAPAAAGSPGWVIRVVDFGTGAWSGHPAQAAVSVVWIQLGIGIWLVSVSSPRWSRLAGLVSVGWGLVVWVFGEAFGGIFAAGLSWLTGAPGAALLYSAAGALLVLPPRYWRDPRLGRWLLQASGALLLGFAVLQAWPGRGSWQGTAAGPAGLARPGQLSADISSMAAASQPTALHDLLAWFADVVARYGFATNLVAVVVLAAGGAALLTARPVITQAAAGAVIGLCLADWLLVQDLGVFSGTGTDPNSMLPQVLIITAGLLAAAPGARQADATALAPPYAAADTVPMPAGRLTLLRPDRAARRLGRAFGTASASAVLTVWAVAMLLMGATPMALAAIQRGPAPATTAAGYRPMLVSAALNADSSTPGAARPCSATVPTRRPRSAHSSSSGGTAARAASELPGGAMLPESCSNTVTPPSRSRSRVRSTASPVAPGSHSRPQAPQSSGVSPS
jgi:hypothetical protein